MVRIHHDPPINQQVTQHTRFSYNPNAWVLEGQGFYRSAKLLMQSLKQPRRTQSKLVSSAEIGLRYSCNKTVCFLYSIAIELFLKALYSYTKIAEDQEKTENFGHDVIKLNKKLSSKGVLQTDELDQEALKLVNFILAWSGRYYKPQFRIIDEVINSCFEEVEGQQNMVKPKFCITPETTLKLEHTAALLSDKLTNNFQVNVDLFFYHSNVRKFFSVCFSDRNYMFHFHCSSRGPFKKSTYFFST